MKQTSVDCPCGSQRTYTACCGLCHDGQPAKTAEALMRSRYSAYSLGKVDYIINTTLPEQQSALKKERAQLKADSTHWIRLDIIRTSQGLQKDPQGIVEFKAWYTDASSLGEQALHETSDFIQRQGRWYYIHPTLPKTPNVVQNNAGRNDPCPCGSGRKYKKCCMNQ